MSLSVIICTTVGFTSSW